MRNVIILFAIVAFTTSFTYSLPKPIFCCYAGVTDDAKRLHWNIVMPVQADNEKEASKMFDRALNKDQNLKGKINKSDNTYIIIKIDKYTLLTK